MAETEIIVEEKKEEIVTPLNPLLESSWKDAPIKQESPDPAIDEKDKKIKEDKPVSDKPDEPEKIPGASPKPIQDRPEETKEEPLKFANEESEKIFNLIKDGKKDEVYTILAEQKKLASVEGADAIKLQLQYQNKDFSPDDITDLFNERYVMPEKPVQLDTEDEDEFKLREEKYNKEVQKVENRIARDAKPAKTELLKLQKEIVLPDIQTGGPQQKKPTQEELDGLRLKEEDYLKTVDGNVKDFSGYKVMYKDEEVEIPVTYVATEEEKQSVNALMESAYKDLPGFFKKVGWVDKEGDINTAKMIEDLHLIQNKEQVFKKFVSETGNKRHEASIKSIKNIDYGGRPNSGGDLGSTPQEKQDKLAQHFFSQ